MLQIYRWPIVLILSTLLVMVSQIVNLPVIGPLLQTWFFLVCPGIAIVGLLPIKQFSIQISLVFALSIAVNTILAEIMAFTHFWSPAVALFLLACLTVSGAILQVWQSKRPYTKQWV